MKTRLLAVAALASGFLLPQFAKADSVIFTGQSGDNYTYDLQIDDHGALFLLDGFDITGLSGVTDAVLTGKLADVFTPNGGVYWDSGDVYVGTVAGYTFSRKSTYSIGTLTITSESMPGVADFAILDSNGYNDGFVQGPVSSTPEPSSLVLLGSGILAAAGAVRRRLA